MGDMKNQKHVMVALEPTMGDHVLKQFVNTIYDKTSQKVMPLTLLDVTVFVARRYETCLRR